MIRKLHHSAYRCRDSGKTRRFYEEFLGMPAAGALEIDATKTRRRTRARPASLVPTNIDTPPSRNARRRASINVVTPFDYR